MPCYSELISKMKEASSELSYLTAQSGSDGLADNSMEFVVFFCDKQDISAIKVDVRMNKELQLVLHHDTLEEGQQFMSPWKMCLHTSPGKTVRSASIAT